MSKKDKELIYFHQLLFSNLLEMKTQLFTTAKD